jgi:hypothetical protein
LRRWEYTFDDESSGKATASKPTDTSTEISADDTSIKHEDGHTDTDKKKQHTFTEATVPLWGLDLESLRSSNTTLTTSSSASSTIPIFNPQSARTYLLSSFASVDPKSDSSSSTMSPEKKPKPKKASHKADMAQKEHNAGLLLRALDLLFASWAPPVLTRAELDRRAWSWYVAVRPEVESGARGWGGKNLVRLGAILDLRRGGDSPMKNP